MATRVEFCQLDARDDANCGYSTVAFCKDADQASLGADNGRLAVLMEREYLVRLRMLQEEIRSKYLSLFNEDEPANGADYANSLEKPEYFAAVAEAKALFPGKTAAFYT